MPIRIPCIAPEKVLLINPPAYDTRLHWKQWQQPVRLLKLATYFKNRSAVVRYVDTLFVPPGNHMNRKRTAIFNIDGLEVPVWRYGMPANVLHAELVALKKSDWIPDEVYIECFTTFWWQGAAEAIDTVKVVFPHTHVVLYGAYPTLAPEHSRKNTAADEIICDPWHDLDCLPADFTLYPTVPTFAYVTLGRGRRSAADVYAEIECLAAANIRQFAFADEAIANRYPELYRSVLDQVICGGLRVKFFALGNISPLDFVEQPDLLKMMKLAGYEQIWLSDDRDIPVCQEVNDQLVEAYRITGELSKNAGFPCRTEATIASVCLGRNGESLAERVRLATIAAHHIGSVVIWAYQPALNECGDMPLELQNSKLFPLRAHNGYTYREYLDVLSLAVVLNSKYRNKTFDFLSNSLMARLFRQSVLRRAWDPDPALKGSLQLPIKVSK